jgi:hypothetical protein
MKNIKNTFMVTALSLGLVVGAVGVAGAATSTNYQKEIADWFEKDPNPVVMHTNTVANPVITPVAIPVVTPVADTKTPVTPVAVTPAPPQTNYHYSDGHSNMNPEQHQQMHITQPSENHMSGSESGHKSGHE